MGMSLAEAMVANSREPGKGGAELESDSIEMKVGGEMQKVDFYWYGNLSAVEASAVVAFFTPTLNTDAKGKQTAVEGWTPDVPGAVREIFLRCIRNADGSRMFSDLDRQSVSNSFNWADVRRVVMHTGLLAKAMGSDESALDAIEGVEETKNG
ncbi:MAG: hypothetical protein AAF515_05045 [Pseudomonadota bacterium]